MGDFVFYSVLVGQAATTGMFKAILLALAQYAITFHLVSMTSMITGTNLGGGILVVLLKVVPAKTFVSVEATQSPWI